MTKRAVSFRSKQNLYSLIYFFLVSVVLAFGIIHLESVFSEVSSDTSYTSNIEAGHIDSKMLESISKFKKSSEVNNLPEIQLSGRSNPFGE